MGDVKKKTDLHLLENKNLILIKHVLKKTTFFLRLSVSNWPILVSCKVLTRTKKKQHRNTILEPAANIKDVNFCKGHRDKTEVPDPLAVEDLISHKFNNRRKLARLITQYRNIYFWRYGLPSSGCYRLLHNLLTRPNKVETTFHGCNSFGFQFVLYHNVVPFCFYVVSALYHYNHSKTGFYVTFTK